MMGFQPCSTVKVSVALAGLSENVVQPANKYRLSGIRMDLTNALAHGLLRGLVPDQATALTGGFHAQAGRPARLRRDGELSWRVGIRPNLPRIV